MKEIKGTRFRKGESVYAEFLCHCGKKHITSTYRVKIGKTKSCGCTKYNAVTTHGRTKTPEYRTWANVKERCLVQKTKNFHNYGGRGITICKEWKDSFENFFKDMGKKPSKNHSIDRIDNNKGYCKENCRWATAKEQANNKRNSVGFTYKGETKTLAQWSEHLEINKQTLNNRFKNGWSIKKALTKPVRKQKKRRDKMLGDLVKKKRTELGLSQNDVAKEFGWSTGQYICNLETGKCGFPLDKAKKLCKILKIKKSEFKYAYLKLYENKVDRSFR